MLAGHIHRSRARTGLSKTLLRTRCQHADCGMPVRLLHDCSHGVTHERLIKLALVLRAGRRSFCSRPCSLRRPMLARRQGRWQAGVLWSPPTSMPATTMPHREQLRTASDSATSALRASHMHATLMCEPLRHPHIQGKPHLLELCARTTAHPPRRAPSATKATHPTQTLHA